jgi:outer membrane cobalamin receptor
MVDQVFALMPAGYVLNPVTVEGRPTLSQRRMQEFERRRQEHRGVFVTAEQIQAAHASTVGDVLRNVPGVHLVCRAGGCVVQMSRSASGYCRPDWVVDGFPANQSGTSQLPTVGIVAIEIYRSPSETPTELLKADSVCGVIAIWTMSGT